MCDDAVTSDWPTWHINWFKLRDQMTQSLHLNSVQWASVLAFAHHEYGVHVDDSVEQRLVHPVISVSNTYVHCAPPNPAFIHKYTKMHFIYICSFAPDNCTANYIQNKWNKRKRFVNFFCSALDFPICKFEYRVMVMHLRAVKRNNLCSRLTR